MLVVLVQDRRGGAQNYGLLVAAIGLGAALGPLLLLRHVKDPRRPLFVFGPYAVRGLVDLVLVLVTSVPLAAAALLADTVGIRAVYLLGGLLLLAAEAVGSAATKASGKEQDGPAQP